MVICGLYHLREATKAAFGYRFAEHMEWFISCLDFNKAPHEFNANFRMVQWNWGQVYQVAVEFRYDATQTGWNIKFYQNHDDEFRVVNFHVCVSDFDKIKVRLM